MQQFKLCQTWYLQRTGTEWIPVPKKIIYFPFLLLMKRGTSPPSLEGIHTCWHLSLILRRLRFEGGLFRCPVSSARHVHGLAQRWTSIDGRRCGFRAASWGVSACGAFFRVRTFLPLGRDVDRLHLAEGDDVHIFLATGDARTTCSAQPSAVVH